MNPKEMIEANVWHDKAELLEFVTVINELSGNTRQLDKWNWLSNPACKYVSIRVDMRDGGFVLLDRDGNRITLDQLKGQ